ncbi:MAG: hypothetical protein EA355_01540 [Rhodobacteraceae bacterium]|nr:MAG: hypothetical protein EA355_01540 [Paracoccaceae bacterium]
MRAVIWPTARLGGMSGGAAPAPMATVIPLGAKARKAVQRLAEARRDQGAADHRAAVGGAEVEVAGRGVVACGAVGRGASSHAGVSRRAGRSRAAFRRREGRTRRATAERRRTRTRPAGAQAGHQG